MRSLTPSSVSTSPFWELTTIEYRFEKLAGLWRQAIRFHFFFRPDQHPAAQFARLHESFHESDLIKAGGQEVSGKVGKRLFAQSTAAIKIIAAPLIAHGKVPLVVLDTSGKPARNRPDAASIKRFSQHRVGHQPSDTAIAVDKGVNPGKAVMRCCCCNDGIHLAGFSVGFLEALHEAGHGARADGDMLANLDVVFPEFTGYHLDALAILESFHPQKVFGQHFAKAPMRFLQSLARGGSAIEAAGIDPFLRGDVRPGFQLQITLLGIFAEIRFQRALDVDRVRVVPLDQVAVVAVHRAHEACQGMVNASGKACSQGGRVSRRFLK